MRCCSKRFGRLGATLVEVLVAIGVVLLLAALAMPAVQSAREASRRMQCQVRLQQIALALQSYSSTHGCFPPGAKSSLPLPDPLSPFARLLPELGEDTLYQQLDPAAFGSFYTNGLEYISPGSETAARLVLSHFLCPSDGMAGPGRSMSYRAVFGSYPSWVPGGPKSRRGLFEVVAGPALRSATDGLSNTAALGERVVGSGQRRGFDRFRDGFSPIGNEPGAVLPADELADICPYPAPAPAAVYSWLGESWLFGSGSNIGLNHFFGPNTAASDCSQTSWLFHWHSAISARSMHPGVVNVAFADGHVVAMADSVALPVWRAISTRAGGETVDPGSF